MMRWLLTKEAAPFAFCSTQTFTPFPGLPDYAGCRTWGEWQQPESYQPDLLSPTLYRTKRNTNTLAENAHLLTGGSGFSTADSRRSMTTPGIAGGTLLVHSTLLTVFVILSGSRHLDRNVHIVWADASLPCGYRFGEEARCGDSLVEDCVEDDRTIYYREVVVIHAIDISFD